MREESPRGSKWQLKQERCSLRCSRDTDFQLIQTNITLSLFLFLLFFSLFLYYYFTLKFSES